MITFYSFLRGLCAHMENRAMFTSWTSNIKNDTGQTLYYYSNKGNAAIQRKILFFVSFYLMHLACKTICVVQIYT